MVKWLCPVPSAGARAAKAFLACQRFACNVLPNPKVSHGLLPEGQTRPLHRMPKIASEVKPCRGGRTLAREQLRTFLLSWISPHDTRTSRSICSLQLQKVRYNYGLSKQPNIRMNRTSTLLLKHRLHPCLIWHHGEKFASVKVLAPSRFQLHQGFGSTKPSLQGTVT